MVSARAYRDPLSFDQASGILQEGIDSAFDRRPVSALVNILDNRGGRERWEAYRQRPDAEAEA
jgi:HD-GYP domain-containing protein (c-di-GMP phosphodiesterase class II)